MNVIFTFQANAPFTEAEQATIDQKAKYVQVPEMRVIETIIPSNDPNVLDTVLRKIPYQANVPDQATFDELKAMLETKGSLKVIGQWQDDGSKISLDINAYRDALRDIETFEDAVFIDGVDFTGRENEYVPVPKLDENGNPVLDADGNQVYETPSYRRFKRFKSKKRPTLAQAKRTRVNVWNRDFIRQLK